MMIQPTQLYGFVVVAGLLMAKNLFNLRNPRLMNYLRAFGIFTLVKMSLQINLFMQNEPNFRKVKMNVNKVLTGDYENKTLSGRGKNEPKTNPIRTQTNPIKANLLNAQINVTTFLTKDYENKLNWALFENKPNTKPIKPNFKPDASSFTEPGPNSLMLFLLFTLFDIPNMIYAIRKNNLLNWSIGHVLLKEVNALEVQNG